MPNWMEIGNAVTVTRYRSDSISLNYPVCNILSAGSILCRQFGTPDLLHRLGDCQTHLLIS